jgi:putative transposase
LNAALFKATCWSPQVRHETGTLDPLTQALERALQAELTDHLGFEKHDPAAHHSRNSRNGSGRKALKGDFGELETRRDRQGSFEPKIVAKGQTRFTGFDDKIVSMYARGMSTREIQGHLQEIYGIEVSPTLISKVTEAIVEEVKAWQSRPLEEVYPIVYLDAMMVKMRDNGQVQNQAIYVVLGVDLSGQKEVLGLWVAAGGSEILAASTDRVEELWGEGYLHRLRGWGERISRGHRSAVSADRGAAVHRASGAGVAELCALEAAQVGGGRSAAGLSSYQAATAEEARQHLEEMMLKWTAYPGVGQVWQRNWERITPFFH